MIIYKYVLGPVTEIKLPENSEVLTVNAQGDNICLWVKIFTKDNGPLIEKRVFKTVPTGAEFKEEDLFYIGTSFMNNGLVFHTFEQRMY